MNNAELVSEIKRITGSNAVKELSTGGVIVLFENGYQRDDLAQGRYSTNAAMWKAIWAAARAVAKNEGLRVKKPTRVVSQWCSQIVRDSFIVEVR